MKKSNFVTGLFVTGVAIIFMCSGCGTQNLLTKARKSGVMLEYKFPESYMTYKQVQDIGQEIDAMGQLIDIDIVSNVDFQTKKNSDMGEDVKIDMKLNSITMSVNAMGQQMNPDLAELDGKEFHMVVSKNGEEVDTHEADEIVFQTSPDEKSSLGMFFNTFFPDLPEQPVKINDTWTSVDSLSFKDGDRFTTIITNNTFTLTDFTELDGVNCAVVTSKYDGTMKGKSYSQGMELDIDGTITGEGTWYFDFENGCLVKDNTTGKVVGKISMAMGEMGLIRNFKNTTELIK